MTPPSTAVQLSSDGVSVLRAPSPPPTRERPPGPRGQGGVKTGGVAPGSGVTQATAPRRSVARTPPPLKNQQRQALAPQDGEPTRTVDGASAGATVGAIVPVSRWPLAPGSMATRAEPPQRSRANHSAARAASRAVRSVSARLSGRKRARARDPSRAQGLYAVDAVVEVGHRRRRRWACGVYELSDRRQRHAARGMASTVMV